MLCNRYIVLIGKLAIAKQGEWCREEERFFDYFFFNLFIINYYYILL